MPSVMTTASPIWASTASMTAALANGGGTKMTLTSAPVSFMASATPPNTGTLAVPEASMRWVCLLPSEPVMPWTMTLLFSLRKIDICLVSFRFEGLSGGEFGGPARGAVHRVDHGHQGVVGLGEDPAALLDVVAVEPDDQRLGGLVAEDAERGDDAVGHGVAGGDPAEDVDEDALDGRVAQDDVQPVGHHLGRSAAADVEEVGRLDAAERLTRVGDDVESAHDQAGAVADDADLAVELDVVEVLLLGRGLERIGRRGVLQGGVLRLPELRVLVEGDL